MCVCVCVNLPSAGLELHCHIVAAYYLRYLGRVRVRASV